MTARTATLMTTEELLALPDDGTERWLIEGRLQERPMTFRGQLESRVVARVSKFLANWLDTQPEPRGEILTGDVGFRLRKDPDTTVGIDVAYVSAEVLARQTDDARKSSRGCRCWPSRFFRPAIRRSRSRKRAMPIARPVYPWCG